MASEERRRAFALGPVMVWGDDVCLCSPGFCSEVPAEGDIRCDECGKVMLAATVQERIVAPIIAKGKA